MAVEIQENGVRRAPLIFTVPAWGYVVAASTKQFQVRQNTNEQMPCPSALGLTAETLHGKSARKRELRRKIASLISGKAELLVFLFSGLVAIVAMMDCVAELFHQLDNAVLEQTVRALLTK